LTEFRYRGIIWYKLLYFKTNKNLQSGLIARKNRGEKMSFELQYGTSAGIAVKTSPSVPYIRFGDYQISVQEFLAIVCKFLSKQIERDLSKQFVRCVCNMRVVDGHLKAEIPFVFDKPRAYYENTAGVYVFNYLVNAPDLFSATIYILTNTKLVGNDDIRLGLVEYLREESRNNFPGKIPEALKQESSFA